MRHVCGILLLTLGLGLPLNAQLSGRISGAVSDATGASVPAANVELFLAGGQKPLLMTETAPDGAFNFVGVRAAVYDVVLTAKGFVKTTLRNIAVDPVRETD